MTASAWAPFFVPDLLLLRSQLDPNLWELLSVTRTWGRSLGGSSSGGGNPFLLTIPWGGSLPTFSVL